MKKFVWPFLPALSIVAFPWFHRLAYENMMMAIPNMTLANAQSSAFGLSITVYIIFGFFTLMSRA